MKAKVVASIAYLELINFSTTAVNFHKINIITKRLSTKLAKSNQSFVS
jgi:hypothetical protein